MILPHSKHLGEHFLRRKSFRLFHSIEESLVTPLNIDHELSFTLLVITDPAKIKVLEFQFLASLINQVLGNFGKGSIGPTFIPHLIHLQEEEFLSRLLELLIMTSLVIAIIDVMMRIVVVSHLVQKGFQDISNRTIQGLGTDRDLVMESFSLFPTTLPAPTKRGLFRSPREEVENGNRQLIITQLRIKISERFLEVCISEDVWVGVIHKIRIAEFGGNLNTRFH